MTTSETNDGEVRERLIVAFSKAAAEQGYSTIDVATVSRYAGLSPAAFYEEFENIEQVLVAAEEEFLRRLWLDVLSACEGPHDWPHRVRDAIAALVATLAEASGLARVFAIEGPGASLAAAELEFIALGRLSELLARGRGRYARAAEMPAITERALIGGAVSIVSEYLLAENPRAISVLQTELVEVLLAPYVGEEEARRISAE